MLRFVLEHIIAAVGGSFYRQVTGIGTGYHSSGAFAEIIVDATYRKAMSQTTPSRRPVTLALYVDDSHSTWLDKSHCDDFVDKLNAVWTSVNFTREVPIPGETPGSTELSFLDTLVRTKSNGALEWELYQKPTHCGSYLNYNSHCEERIKINIVRTEARRVLRRCSSRELALPHLEKLRSNLYNSGYPWVKVSNIISSVLNSIPTQTQVTERDPEETFSLIVPYTNEAALRKIRNVVKKSKIPIRVSTKSGTKIGSMVKRNLAKKPTSACNCKIHDQDLNCEDTHVVYKASCRSCNVDYIGVTTRPLKQRLGEHETAVRTGQSDKSALSEHCLNSHEEEDGMTGDKGRRNWEKFFDRFDVKVIRRTRDTLGARLAESQEISRCRPTLNRREELKEFIF